MWLHDTHPSFCFSLDIQCGHHRLMARVVYMLVWNRKVNSILYFRKVLDTKLCDKVCQRDRSVVFSDTPVSSTNKTDCHDIIEILLKYL